MIEKFFDQVSLVNNIFDPVPSYADLWCFDLENIINNVNKNDWEEFYKNSYKDKLMKIFNNEEILNIEVGMISKPNNEMRGRCLQYNKYDFFIGVITYLTDEIDNYGLNEEERNKRIEKLITNISDTFENRNIYFSEVLNEKKRKLKDVLDKEFNSEYFDVAMKDYNIYKNVMSFSEYIKKYYKVISDFQLGILRLGDFFEQNIDINKFCDTMDLDKFSLLFAKIICDINNQELNDNYRYLCFYKHILDNILKEDNKYNISIIYIDDKGKKVIYTIRDFIKEYNKLEEKYLEIKNYKLPDDIDNHDSYKDISLMEKIRELNKQNNWQFLNKNEKINKSDNKDINLRIDILENSGFISRPLQNNNYYAFIYPNELVIIENFSNDEEATYIMNIDNFINFSKENIKILDYAKNKEIHVKRIFHTSINNWQRNLFDEINGTYNLEDALNFINSLD